MRADSSGSKSAAGAAQAAAASVETEAELLELRTIGKSLQLERSRLETLVQSLEKRNEETQRKLFVANSQVKWLDLTCPLLT